MNIFMLDWDVKKCAEYHCNKHCTKMCVEYAQLLCGAHHITNSKLDIPYKLTHKNHPCSIWVRNSLSNYLYLCELGLELCKEYTYRYGKRHKSQDVIEWCVTNLVNICDKGVTEPPKAMPDEYKTKDVIQSYKNYYIGAKKEFALWKKREIPTWFSEKNCLELV
jgi:hypothetical protein